MSLTKKLAAKFEQERNGRKPDSVRETIPTQNDDDETQTLESRFLAECMSIRRMAEAFPELQPPVFDGLLRLGEVANVVSVSKIGKSWLGYYLALCIVTGRSAFDSFPTTKGKVLLLDNELEQGNLQKRIHAVASAMDLKPDEWCDDFDAWGMRENPLSISQIRMALRASEPGRYRLIILDSKYRSLDEGMDENRHSDDARYYSTCHRIIGHTKSAMLLTLHSSKGDQSGKRVSDVGSGAGTMSRAADSHIILREHADDGCVTLDAVVRSFPPIKPIALRWEWPLWTPDSSLNPANLKRTGGLEALHQRQNEEADSDVLDALDEPWKSRRAIREITGMGDPRVQKALKRLEKSGKVEHRDEGDTRLYRKTIWATGNEPF